MKQEILDKIKNTIVKYNMIEPGDGVVVGLSGGPDSVCLFHALCVLKDDLNIGEITAVHINHGLRGEESDGDEESARLLADSMKAEFISFKYDVNEIAAKTGEGTEEAGRRLRYGAFEKVRRWKGAARIAVAHNRNDQAETVMMRIMRGTGLRGLSGIDFIRSDGIVIRPVLDLSRDEIECYCDENGLEPRIDSTNNEAIYTRNKIRLELLPMMREKFNPNVVDALVRLSSQAREDEDFIMSAAVEFADGPAGSGCNMRQYTSPIGNVINANTDNVNGTRWNQTESSLWLDGFDKLHSAVAKRVIMLCASRAGMEQNMSTVNLETVLELAKKRAEGKETDLADGFYARVSYGKLWMLRRVLNGGCGCCNCSGPEGARDADCSGSNYSGPEGARGGGAARGSEERRVRAEAAALPVEQLERTDRAAVVFHDHKIKLSVFPAPAVAEELKMYMKGVSVYRTPGGIGCTNQRNVLLYLDFDLVKIKKHVIIRTRMPGDRISPLGMKGSKKLQDYFVDRRIPKHLRDEVLLIVSEGRVIAAGREVSSECPVNAETKQILSIEY